MGLLSGLFGGGGSSTSSSAETNYQDRRIAATDYATVSAIQADEGSTVNQYTDRSDRRVITLSDFGAIAEAGALARKALDTSSTAALVSAAIADTSGQRLLDATKASLNFGNQALASNERVAGDALAVVGTANQRSLDAIANVSNKSITEAALAQQRGLDGVIRVSEAALDRQRQVQTEALQTIDGNVREALGIAERAGQSADERSFDQLVKWVALAGIAAIAMGVFR